MAAQEVRDSIRGAGQGGAEGRGSPAQRSGSGWAAPVAGVLDRLEDFGVAARAAGRLAREWFETGLLFHPVGAGFARDPYAVYRKFRERDPVHRSHAVGGYVLFRYEDVASVLRDARFSSDDRQFYRNAEQRARLVRRGALDPEAMAEPSMLRRDPPDHTRLRALVQRAFTPRAVEALRPRIEEIVEEQLAALPHSGTIELMDGLAHPLPLIVIAEMLGVSSEDREQFKRWSGALARSLGQVGVGTARTATLAARALRGYFGRVAEERRLEPRSDLMSALLAAEEAGDRLSHNEVFATLTLLLVAGNETTTNLIGNGLVALLANPEQLARVREDPEALDMAVEEMLRYDSPVQATARAALEDVQVGNRTVRRGEQLMLLLGSANRDPERFPDPDRFDPSRGDRGHLAFGVGRHICLGAALARLEARAAFRGLLRRYSRIELAEPEVEWTRSAVLRGPLRLSLRVAP